MSEEVWLSIPFAPEYKASSFGSILGKRGRILNPSLNDRDYLVVSLNGVQYRVNRVICHVFHGPSPSDLHHAAHKDSNKSNNREDNLYWATPLENANDLSATNKNKGENSFASVLKEQDVLLIREMYSNGKTIAFIARRFENVTRSNIQHIVDRRSWKHL